MFQFFSISTFEPVCQFIRQRAFKNSRCCLFYIISEADKLNLNAIFNCEEIEKEIKLVLKLIDGRN